MISLVVIIDLRSQSQYALRNYPFYNFEIFRLMKWGWGGGWIFSEFLSWGGV